MQSSAFQGALGKREEREEAGETWICRLPGSSDTTSGPSTSELAGHRTIAGPGKKVVLTLRIPTFNH